MSIEDRLCIDEINFAKGFGDLVPPMVFDDQTGDAGLRVAGSHRPVITC
jgi:hypothetical protein